MSEQSPWGTPPPQSYGPPGGGYPGGGYPGGPGHGGPSGPPPRKRTGLIIGIVVLVVLLAGGLGTSLALLAGGDDDDGDAKDDPTSQTDSPTADPTDDPTDSPTDDVSTPPSDDAISGDGYTYELPGPGWKNATDDAGGLGATIDTVSILGSSFTNAQSNILVEALSAGTAATPEDLQPLWERNISGSDNATPTAIDDITIDGEHAVGIRVDDRKNARGVLITQIAYLALHDGNQYSIALSFPASGDKYSEGDFQKALDSWQWTS